MYAIFGGVVWSAYEEFGHQPLHNFAPLVVADRTPLKLLPGEGTSDPTALPVATGSELRQFAPAASLNPGEASEADTLVVTARPASAPYHTEPVAASEAPGSEAPVAIALETPALDVRVAAPLASAPPAAAEEALHSGRAATWPPSPALKPLDVVPMVMAELAPPKDGTTEPSRLGERPPVPSPKPIVMPSEQRPGSPAGRDTRLAAATGPGSLPDALRAFWANLKILLASGPAPRVIPAGGKDSDRWLNRSEGGGFANAGTGGGSRSGGGKSGTEGGGSSSAKGGGSSGGDSSSASGGSTNGGGGGGSTSSGGGSTNGGGGGSTSSGGGSTNGGVSVGGGDKGGGKGGGGKGGKGGAGKGGRGGGGDDDDDGDD